MARKRWHGGAPFVNLAMQAPRQEDPAWDRTAGVLLGWARANRLSPDTQGAAIRAHCAGSIAWLRLDPADGRPIPPPWDKLQQYVDGILYDAVLGTGAGSFTSGPLTFPVRQAARVAHIRAPGCLEAVKTRALEEWILLAEGDALGALPAEVRAPLDGSDADAYAVAWDWTEARGLVNDGGTDDGLRACRGVDARGESIPTWARRTALIRSILRGQALHATRAAVRLP